MNRNILRIYYAATAVFVFLDFGFGVNVRAAFLDSAPTLRVLFYVVLFACFALVIWRPAWTNVVGLVESVVTLAALIINMALRSMMITHDVFATGAGPVTMAEIVNFMISGGAAYVSYTQGLKWLANRSGAD
ncbi:MAG: hypothetical protein QNJ23_05640 [Woeseiaceae bacterium]|nr:hypothetical protein [Woeseiaceae bacterium]